jgi:hypothetical protein
MHGQLLDSIRWNPGLWLGSLAFLLALWVGGPGSEKIRTASKAFLVVGFLVGVLRILVSIYFKNQSFFSMPL